MSNRTNQTNIYSGSTDDSQAISVLSLIQQQVQKAPDGIAVIFEEEELTYQQLDQRSSALANMLREKGIDREKSVVICIPRSINMIVAMMAVLKSGGAYVPIDPEHPIDRINYMLEDCGASVVLTETEFEDRFVDQSHVELICLDNLTLNSHKSVDYEPQPNDLAYVIYTSGSTGRPKGVMIEHHSLNDHLHGLREIFDLSNKDRFMLFANFIFDASTEEILTAFIAGATLVIPTKETLLSDKLLDYIIKTEVTTTGLTPRFAEAILMPLFSEDKFITQSKLRLISLGGEAISKGFCSAWFASPISRNCDLWNLYGPTETTITATGYMVTHMPAEGSIPIGKGIGNTKTYVLNNKMERLPTGEPGELYISGTRVGRGYLNKPDLTKEKFLQDPFDVKYRMYKTGDLVKMLPDGNIEFLGRTDFQVKIRGFRIELEEVENAISQNPLVQSVTVLTKEHGGINHLIAFYTSVNGQKVEDIRTELKKTLPDYMIPSSFTHLAVIPLTVSNKVDRDALVKLPVTLHTQEYSAPETDTQRQLVSIWEEVLGTDHIGIDHNFFELGGHSLLAGKITSRIASQLNSRVAISKVLLNPSIRELAAIVHYSDIQTKSLEIPLGERSEVLPLSFAQEGLWFLSKLQYSSQYHNYEFLETTGHLDIENLQLAIDHVVSRHESLTASFIEVESQPKVVLAQKLNIQIASYDFSLDNHKGESTIDRVVQDFINRPFNLSQAPLVRFIAIKLDENRYYFGLCVHHIISDGWSVGLLLHEIASLYNQYKVKRPANLPSLKIRYTDYSLWQKKLLATDLSAESEYWRKQLQGHEDFQMPTDYSRPPQLSGKGSTARQIIPVNKVKELTSFCQQHQITLFSLLMSGVYIVLKKYSRQNDICIGMPVAGRGQEALEHLFGFFVNTLVIRIGKEQDHSVSVLELLKQVNATILEAQDHQNTPFEKLVEDLQPSRDLSRNPFFQVTANYNADYLANLEFDGSTVKPLKVENHTAKFDLSFNFNEQINGDLEIALEFSTDLYTSKTTQGIVSHLYKIYDHLLVNTDFTVNHIPLITEAERKEVLLRSQNKKDYSNVKCIHELFKIQASQTPDKAALRLLDKEVTYKELDQQSDALAVYLSQKGVSDNSLVGVYLSRSIEMIVTIFGVLKAGGAYVPIDPEYPADRVKYMLEDSQLKWLVTADQLEVEVKTISHGLDLNIVNLSNRLSNENDQVNESDYQTSPDQLAYVIYTSGSTGKPKGVLVKHSNVTSLLQSTEQNFDFNQQDVWTFFHSYCFDFSVWEIFGCLSYGGELVIVPHLESRDPKLFLSILRKHKVTVLNQTPTAFYQLLGELEKVERQATNLRYIIFGGEAINPPRLKIWYDLYPTTTTKLINMYGITETTVHVTFHELTQDNISSAKSVIGDSIDSLQIYILDDSQSVLPIGVQGEMYVSGAGVASGYLNKPELSKERFIANPFLEGDRLYKTGDLARRLPDHTIEYLGRIDQQVQLRGFRIEPGEIESVISSVRNVMEAAVIVKKANGTEMLLAFYTLKNTGIEEQELRQECMKVLPSHMVPNLFIAIDKMPVTSNGKTDRKALSHLELKLNGSNEYAAPSSETEYKLVDIWRQVLAHDKVGVNDNFFDLGGHSLMAVQIISRINKQFKSNISLRDLFEQPRIADLAKLIQATSTTFTEGLTSAIRPDKIPLSYAQERLLFLAELGHGDRYHIPLSLRLNGQLNVLALQKAMDHVFSRHESLRTTFAKEENRSVQYISDEAVLEFDFRDQKAANPENSKAEYQNLIKEFVQRPFDLTSDTLIRVMLIRLSESEFLLTICMHHIISDGWSMNKLMNEVNEAYIAYENETLPQLDELSVQYPDYAIWQREMLTDEIVATDLDYWKSQLEGFEDLDMPTDFNRPTELTGKGEYVQFKLENSNGLKHFCQKHRVTPFTLLLTSVYVLLTKYSHQKDICIGVPVANRNDEAIEKLIGFFVNTLIIRIANDENQTGNDLTRFVHETVLRAQEHQNLPFEKLVEHLNPARDLSRSPFFQVLATYNLIGHDDLRIGDLEIQTESVDYQVSKFDLSFNFIEHEGAGLTVNVEYSSDLYTHDTITRMVNHLQVIVNDLVAFPTRDISEIVLLQGHDKTQVLQEWNETDNDFKIGKCLHELICNQAYENPDGIALIFDDQTLSYRELDQRSDRIGAYLITQGIQTEDLVGICFNRSIDMIVAIIGVLKSGGAYVPIDPEYPVDRIQYMLEDSNVQVILCHDATEPVILNQMTGEAQELINLDRDKDQIFKSQIGQKNHVSPSNLAYVIYTSGSTGKPKGVMVEHQAYANTALDQTIRLNISSGMRCLQFASVCFDASVFEIFTCLLGGATLVIMDEESRKDKEAYLKFLSNHKVDFAIIPPTLLRSIDRDDRLKLKTLMTAGESAEYIDVKYYADKLRYINAYGPTENSVCTSFYDVIPSYIPDRIPIGKPISNTRAYVLDENLNPLPVGIPGELYVSGNGLARGYLNKKEETKKRFKNNPWLNNARMYKTGDMVKWLPDGNLDFLGRTDDQVKIRGFRIELGEIENALLSHSKVSSSCVVKKKHNGNPLLVAYYTSAEDTDIQDLRSFITKKLPEYMVPGVYVRYDVLPLLPNEKVDRKKLTNAPIELSGSEEYVAPSNDIERQLAIIWQETLKIDRVGVYDNFFEIGGHSLIATQIISRINQELKANVKLSALFKALNIYRLAEEVAQSEEVALEGIISDFGEESEELTI